MAVAAFMAVVVVVSTAAVVSMVVAAADSMVEVSTGVVSLPEDFTVAASASADSMAAALMPFTPLRGQHTISARVTSKPVP